MSLHMPLMVAALFGVAACSQGSSVADERPASAAKSLLAPAIRRLSAQELEQAADAVLQTNLQLASSLPPDARQHDFSRSLTQAADSLTLTQWYDVTKAATEKVDLASAAFPACAATAGATDDACATTLIAQVATRAFRRAPTAAESASLKVLFDTAASGGSFRDGVVLLLRGLLGAPQLVYETALGDAPATSGAVLRLNDAELASHLAWLVSGAPPDDELIAAAARGDLRSSTERERQAWRLLAKPDSRYLYRRFVEDWLGISRLGGLAKSSTVVSDFPAVREAMLRETDVVVDDVMAHGGSLQTLLAGGFSLPPVELAELYGIQPTPPGQRVSLARLGRVGILQQASFLATFAHEGESAPVLRGKAVLERLLCRHQTPPSELGIDLVLPEPDPTATTRERYDRHASVPLCAQCHETIDGIGFSFENFDAVGRARSEEAGKPIDSSGHLRLDGAELALPDSTALARALVESEEFYACAAKHWVRFAAGEEASAVEEDFVAETQKLPVADRHSLLGLMLAYVKGDWFSVRKAP